MDLSTLYRDIVETSFDGIWVIDTAGRTLYANRRVAQMLGRDPDDLESLTVFDALDGPGREQFAEHLLELRRGAVHPNEVECLWVRGDGTELWVLVRETVLYDDAGNPQGFLHRVTDYSERRALFQELSHSRQLLSEAQRIAKVGGYEWDVARDLVVASDELHALYGVSREEFGNTFDAFLEMVHADDRQLVLDAVQQALERTGVFDVVIRMRHGSGALLWIRGRGEVLRDEHGAPTQIRGTHQDVTDAKQSEQALQDLVAQNTLMQAIATAANEAESLDEVLLVGQGLLLQHDDWVRGRGYLPDGCDSGLVPLDLDPRGVDAREPQSDPQLDGFEHQLAVRAMRSRGQVWDEETHPGRPSIAFPVMLGSDVVAVNVITSCRPFERHDMIRAMIDQVAVQIGRVAERERAAKELAAARDAAMAASRQKSEFLATMSHEIRTPLNGVIGLNDLLLRTELDAHQQRLASGGQVASRALLSVVNDILDFSKIEAGKLEIEAVDFEVRPVFDQVASVLAESARTKDLELLVSCHPDVPEFLNGDPTRLAQVLTNLGSNAVKFTAEGEVAIRATAEPGAGGDVILRVEVSDTGVGVDPAQRRHIFDPFSQADTSTTRQFGGTGLGLAISSEIIAALDGEIDVVSVPGEGALFWFTARFGAAGRRRPAGTPRHEALAGRRVLVVDDNAHNRQILSEHLARWRIRSSTAAGAAQALDLMTRASAEDDGFDAVLLDMAMPECDGLQLASMIRREESIAGASLIMLTSSTRVGAKDLAAVGILECLTKPVLADEVLDAMLRALVGAKDAPTGTRRRPEAGPEVAEADRPRLLVVEDNPVNRLVALGILETLGYSADTANDGVEALEALREDAGYAAILMDVQMPRMDGYATTRAIREAEADGERIPVLAMTAAAVEGEREKCLAAGMDDFLTKPVNPEALGVMLGRWLTGDPAEVAAPRPPAEPGAGVLDTERLDMLRDLDPGSTRYLDKAIGNFVSRVPEAVHSVRAAVTAKDPQALTHAAHRLKGSALNLGLPAVGHLAHELELLGDTGSTAEATDLLSDLEEALTRAVGEIRRYQRSYRAAAEGTVGPAA